MERSMPTNAMTRTRDEAAAFAAGRVSGLRAAARMLRSEAHFWMCIGQQNRSRGNAQAAISGEGHGFALRDCARRCERAARASGKGER